MKRYMKLIQLLLEFAEQQEGEGFVPPPECREFTCQQVHYHVGLCGEAGYLQVLNVTPLSAAYTQYRIGRLTWQGQETLASMRGE